VGRLSSSTTVLVLALLTVSGCSSGPSGSDDAAYVKQVESQRADKDRDFRELPECGPGAPPECSPVPPANRSKVLPLKYYAPDPSYSVAASLRLRDERPVFEMPTSTGTVRRMQLVGVLEFTLKGQPMTLGAFVEEGTQQISQLFVPFADLTTGKDTYDAGRYLDLHPTATNIYEIDFNRAYNPYCAYSKAYECPFPPPSNRLKVAVTAGEKAPSA
jgi:uncharacterized protein (DUF1684 family)